MSMSETLPGGICAYTPDLYAVDTYQRTVLGQIIYDTAGGTIRGRTPLQYMHDGLAEELQESWGEDPIYRTYSRMGSLYRELEGFSPGEVSPGAIELHQKEFGDSSWYLANRLSLQSVLLSQACRDMTNTPRV